MSKTQFVSNVQKDVVWQKEKHAKWSRIINQIGVIIEDEIHKGKNNTVATLKAGSKVIIDDIRGRVLPQYRVKDESGKIWFVSATNVRFESTDYREDSIDTKYRGGIRVDNTSLATGTERYPRPELSTEDILNMEKDKKDA